MFLVRDARQCLPVTHFHSLNTCLKQQQRQRRQQQGSDRLRQADVLLFSLGAEGCTGWQKHAATRLGRQRTAASHTHKLSDEQVGTIQANRILAKPDAMHFKHRKSQARRKTWRWQRDDLHQPFAEDQEMCEEPNQCMDEETEDPFGDLQHNLDKDLTTTSSATEHSEPN